jgi:hypothetical protein
MHCGFELQQPIGGPELPATPSGTRRPPSGAASTSQCLGCWKSRFFLIRHKIAFYRSSPGSAPVAYTIEGRAFKFGDAPNSHVMISANRKELHNSFNFTMDFRTHYPNGLLLFSSVRINLIAIIF